jgi:hypothetical protein
MQVHQRVEVHTRYDDSWGAGFEIAAVAVGGYVVRRLSDGTLLPGVTGDRDVRPLSAGNGF